MDARSKSRILAALKNAAEKLKSLLRQASLHRVTRSGVLFTLAAVLVGVAAVASANNLLFLILAAMLSTLLVSGFVSRISLAGLELDFTLPEHITARHKTPALIQVGNAKKRVPSFSVRLAGTGGSAFSTPLYFPVLPGGSILEETVEVRFGTRGIHHENSFLFSTSFPFGFLERRAHVTMRRDILVYPSIEAHCDFEELFASVRGDLEMQARGRGHDFHRIRPYEAMESARHVDWKATAHTGELQVREFAREQERLLEIFLDLDVSQEYAAWFEHAIDCCAFLVWRVSERAARVRFRSQSWDITIPEMGDVYSILKLLALAERKPGKPPIAAAEDTASQIVFTTAPRARMTELGWESARIIGPGFLPASTNPRA